MSSTDGTNWDRHERILGPFSYTSKIPFYSMIIEADGRITIAVLKDDSVINIYSTGDLAGGFSLAAEVNSNGRYLTTPRLFERENGGYILFFNRAIDASVNTMQPYLTTYYTSSANGRDWEPIKALVPLSEEKLIQSFQSFYTWHDGIEYIVYAVYTRGEVKNTYQLYMQYSQDNRATWSDPLWLTNFDYNGTDSLEINNQRAFLLSDQDGMHIVWERGPANEFSEIFYAKLGMSGLEPGSIEAVTQNRARAFNPRLNRFKGIRYLLWFDNRNNDSNIFLAHKEGRVWMEQAIGLRDEGNEIYPFFITTPDSLHIAWLNDAASDYRLLVLNPDTSVPTPDLRANNFTAGQRRKQDVFSVNWSMLVEDSSGITGYSYSVDRNPEGIPPADLLYDPNIRNVRETVTEDGLWYFHLRVRDVPGNWSDVASLSFFRDTTAPAAVTFSGMKYKDDGALTANTGSINWNYPREDDFAGFIFDYYRAESEKYSAAVSDIRLRSMPAAINRQANSIAYDNIDNGLWVLRVSTVDQSGNIGTPATLFFKLNEYIPVTIISKISKSEDRNGYPSIRIDGRGFTDEGKISRIVLTRSRGGELVPDYEFTLRGNDYDLISDRIITNLRIDNIDEGDYWIVLDHQKRGLKYSSSKIYFESTGAVKFGNYQILEASRWSIIKDSIFRLPLNTILLVSILGLMAFAFFFILGRVGSVAIEAASLRNEAKYLLLGSPQERISSQKRILEMKKQGLGLRVKFALSISALILIVVMMVAFPLGIYMTNTQEENLASGLDDTITVLMDSLVSSLTLPLKNQEVAEMQSALRLRQSLRDSLYVTLTGEKLIQQSGLRAFSAEPLDINYYWVSDDPEKNSKLDLEGDEKPFIGMNTYSDEISGQLDLLAEKIEQEMAGTDLAVIDRELTRLNNEFLKIITEEVKFRNTAEKLDAQQAITTRMGELENKFNELLADFSKTSGSFPQYSRENISETETMFIFYKPVLYRTNSDPWFVHGFIRLAVSTERIVSLVKKSRQILFFITLGIAAFAIALGVLGALVLAASLIRPIRRLVQAVEMIRDTEDKEELKNHQIVVKTKDEIAQLADAVNQMTMGLVKAAVASKDLTVGKEVQKMFIPLEKDSAGKKLTTGKEDLPEVSFFGYYEGAKGVSGDYFDFQRLDDNYYAIIKCDVAGKGVPASLIMVEVATIFIDHFKAWDPKNPNLNLVGLVNRINDLLEERGFKGRFAALSIVLMNIKTGKCLVCHAGDKFFTYFDGQQKQVVVKELPEIPATGVFPTMMLEMRGGYQQIPHTLKPGDTLILSTDGIEESQRLLRNEQFEPISISDKNAAEGADAKIGKEELGIDRFHEIIRKVYTKGVFRLEKLYNPIAGEELVFDFSGLDGKVEDAVMALISIEKIWRIYPDTRAGNDDRIQLDRKVDEFLKKTFNRYSAYFHSEVVQDVPNEYVYYSYLKEDEQFDDLTILGIMKK
ncbi:MAG: SpoIIE family protein phosphatase [Spirochaetales bacterium]|nr:SpoIIE family protein phosphatase [Spirochaetales bacterium]